MERVERVLIGPAIDRELEGFVEGLSPELCLAAKGLATTLGLAPEGVPWSQVFGHEVTLGAPALVSEAMERAGPRAIASALRAHALAVVGAFGQDRVEDGQVAITPSLEAVLRAMTEARDAALASCVGAEPPEDASFALAHARTTRAILEEKELLAREEPVDYATYVRVSRGKQQVGLPASIGLALAAGWGPRERRSLGRMLEAVWLGLQLHDDVLDWEDDLRRSGGAWAVALAKGIGRRDGDTRPILMATLVASTGVLSRMLRGSARFFRGARRRAERLGARSLAAWARERERKMSELAANESAAPGYANRAHALASWASTFLT